MNITRKQIKRRNLALANCDLVLHYKIQEKTWEGAKETPGTASVVVR